jgi:hypothetical protein
MWVGEVRGEEERRKKLDDGTRRFEP